MDYPVPRGDVHLGILLYAFALVALQGFEVSAVGHHLVIGAIWG